MTIIARTNVSTKSMMKKAEEFHGHLGPFLAVGVRMGQIGLKELGLNDHMDSLRIHLKVLPSVPYSCIIDGLQVSTRCTVGNQRLLVGSAENIEAKFTDLSNGRNVAISIQPAVFSMLKEQIVEKWLSDAKLRTLAWTVASMPEKVLCIVKNG